MLTTRAIYNQNVRHTIIILIVIIIFSWIQQHKPTVTNTYDVYFEYDIVGLDTIPVDTIFVSHY